MSYKTSGRLIIRIGFAVKNIQGFKLACFTYGSEIAVFLLREIPLRALLCFCVQELL